MSSAWNVTKFTFWEDVTANQLPEESARWTDDGWLKTGDVVTIDECYVRITDSQKDLIKSGGEWISSVDLENAIVAHPAVKEAVVAIPHPRWQERPLALIVPAEGRNVTAQDCATYCLKICEEAIAQRFCFRKRSAPYHRETAQTELRKL